jgi:hypothetical protein
MTFSGELITTRICAIGFLIAVIALIFGIAHWLRVGISHLDNPTLVRRDLETMRLIAYVGMSCAFAFGVFIAKLLRKL